MIVGAATWLAVDLGPLVSPVVWTDHGRGTSASARLASISSTSIPTSMAGSTGASVVSALFGALLLPLTGCVFAGGSDDEGNEALRDRVRELEKRVDRIERPSQVITIQEATGKVQKVVIIQLDTTCQ